MQLSEEGAKARRNYYKKYYQKNRDKLKAKSRKYRQEHKEDVVKNYYSYWERLAAKEDLTNE